MNKFGERLRSLRSKQNLTQKEMSKLLQVSESAIGMYERGERQPSFLLVDKMADYFEVSTDYLLGRIEEAPAEERKVEFALTPSEFKLLKEIKNHPLFNQIWDDLTTDPQKKVKILFKMWEALKDEED